MQGVGCRARVVSALGLWVALAAMAGPAWAGPQLFPADQALVPVAVAGAFAFPALVAALYSGLRRIAGGIGAVVGLGVMAVLGLALAGFLNPELMPSLRI